MTTPLTTTNIVNKSNDLFARLLATENISVIYDAKCETASFDVKERVLRLPVWDVPQSAIEMLIGHEVGHALFTPQGVEPLMAAINLIDATRPNTVKHYINAIEDVRIERLIKSRFAGLRHAFIAGYRCLDAKGMFNDFKHNQDKLILIDKVNMHFKMGLYLGTFVPFTAAEQVVVDEIATIETWEDTVRLAKRIYEIQAEREDEKPDDMEGQDKKQGEGDGDDRGEGDQKGESEIRGTAKGKPNQPRQQQEYQAKGYFKGVNQFTQPAFNTETGIVPVKLMDEIFQRDLPFYGATTLVDQIIQENKTTVMRMVADFERKKAQAENRRENISRTGKLDMSRIHNYKFDDQLFLSQIEVAKGQSHGMVMIVDYSSSMSNCMWDTLIQTLNLVKFCRRVGIPYTVLLFHDMDMDTCKLAGIGESSAWQGMKMNQVKSQYSDDMITNLRPSFDAYGNEWVANMDSQFNFREIANSTAKELTERRVFDMLLQEFSQHITKQKAEGYNINYATMPTRQGGSYGTYENANFGRQLVWMCGTPLGEATIAACEVVKSFQAKHGVNVVNTVFLTDGDGSSNSYTTQYNHIGDVREQDGSNLIVKYCGTVYHLQEGTRQSWERSLLKASTGCNIMGFFITSVQEINKGKSKAQDQIARYTMYGDANPAMKLSREILEAQVYEDGFFYTENVGGYDIHFTISSQDCIGVNDIDYDETPKKSTAGVAQIRRTFIKGMQKVGASRILLNKVTDYISQKSGLVKATIKRKQPLEDSIGATIPSTQA